MHEWTVGTFPVPEWIVTNPDWSVWRQDTNYFFERKTDDGLGAASVWLLATGEVVRWVDGVWYFGEAVIEI